ncbi:MAG: hypothetical protein HY252_11455 [Sphingobacteriales bacterium]|nr:hypothetical protein [Sphingobacteriales bacterium]
MQLSDKIVTEIPIKVIQFDNGVNLHKKKSDLTKSGLKNILQHRPVQFIVANVGDRLRFIDINECFDFWKKEVEKHLVDNVDKIYLDSYSDNYAYIASEWTGKTPNPIVLLEKIH